MSKRATAEDLRFAVEWLDFYDGGADGEDDDNMQARDRVVAWLEAEIARREDAAGAREVSRTIGRKVTPREFREAARR